MLKVKTLNTLFLTSIACCLALAIGAAPASAAKIKASATIVSSADGVRIQVALTSPRKLSVNRKPKSVKVKAAGKTVKLARVKAATASAGYASSWQSAAQTGAYADQLKTLGGKRVTVTIATRRGRVVNKPKAIVQTAPVNNIPGTPAVPLFAVPAAALTGMDAFNHLGQYFSNSAFSDCTAPWPACAVEERYVHCPTGSWEYHRNTPTSGSDIHSYDSFSVTGATVNADGSWAVSYTTGSGGQYYWEVATNGIANGQYTFGGSGQALGPMYWSQPAITWQKPAGAC